MFAVGVLAHAANNAPAGGSDRPTPVMSDVIYKDYTFRDGKHLDQVRIHYATLGTPHKNAEGVIDNAMIMLPWTNASSDDLLTGEYQTALFAPGAPFDASRFFVILPDPIGQGRSSKPSDGLKAAFPDYGYGDMVDLEHRLVTETLGIPHIRAVVGMSMGCMNAWQWAEAYPSAMDGVMPVACFPAPVSGRNLLWRRIMVDTIKNDPSWQGGNYQQQPASLATAAQLIRMMIDGVPALQQEFPTRAKVDGTLAAIRGGAAGQADANNLIHVFQSSGDFNAEPELGKITAKVYALNFADDEFYANSLQILQRDMPKVANGRFEIRAWTPGSVGHLSMTHPALWADQARVFSNWLDAK